MNMEHALAAKARGHRLAPPPAVMIAPRRGLIRGHVRDSLMTFDQLGPRFARGFVTHDHRTVDSAGAFLVGELERLDQTLNMPLTMVTWGRDIDLREDVTMGDEASAFMNTTFGGAGGINPTGKNWIGKVTDAISGISVDVGKTSNPLNIWGTELKYTIPELESSVRLGRPIDQQKFDGMNLKHQMDTDEQVYVGDAPLGLYGLTNSPAVTLTNVAIGAQGTTGWSTKTPDEILADVNNLLNLTWAASGWAVMPDRLLLPPRQYGFIVSQKVSNAGNISIIEFLRNNSLSNAANGRPLDIQPLKWLVGGGAGGTIGIDNGHDRMVAYTKRRDLVRFPMTTLQRTPLEYRSIYMITTYICRLGVVEFVYPETLMYADGL
jgi:hypothetical protein